MVQIRLGVAQPELVLTFKQGDKNNEERNNF